MYVGKGRKDPGADVGLWEGPTPIMKAILRVLSSLGMIDMVWFCIEWRERGGHMLFSKDLWLQCGGGLLCCLHVHVGYLSIIC